MTEDQTGLRLPRRSREDLPAEPLGILEPPFVPRPERLVDVNHDPNPPDRVAFRDPENRGYRMVGRFPLACLATQGPPADRFLTIKAGPRSGPYQAWGRHPSVQEGGWASSSSVNGSIAPAEEDPFALGAFLNVR